MVGTAVMGADGVSKFVALTNPAKEVSKTSNFFATFTQTQTIALWI